VKENEKLQSQLRPALVKLDQLERLAGQGHRDGLPYFLPQLGMLIQLRPYDQLYLVLEELPGRLQGQILGVDGFRDVLDERDDVTVLGSSAAPRLALAGTPL
jgi:hypothetical protein